MKLLGSWASHLNPSCSLRTRLGIVIAFTALILSVLASLIVGRTASAQVKVNVGQSLAELSYQMTDKLDRGMFERYRDLQIISTLNALRSPSTPISEQRNLLEKLQSTYINYAWIGFTDSRGVVRASTKKLLEGKNVGERPWFIAGQKAAYVGDVHEAMKLAKLLPNSTSEPLRFVDISVPVSDLQGSFSGVLGAHLSWTWAKEVENSLLYPLQGRNLEMFVFRPVLASIETVRLAAEAKGIEIVTTFVPVGQVMGDVSRLQQVFWNLVSNAIKFTPANGSVEVRITRVGDYAQVQVSNNGKGINPEFIPYLFDYFRQEDSTTTRKYGGLGLGLAIARNIVEMHGGIISATSLGDGQGATFTVNLL